MDTAAEKKKTVRQTTNALRPTSFTKLKFLTTLTMSIKSIQVKLKHIFAISLKETGGILIFCLQINTKVFDKQIISLQLHIFRRAQITQNNKSAISLQYLKENVKNEFDFLPADNYERFLQIDTIILVVSGQVSLN